MPQFIVSQSPKAKYRGTLGTSVMVVEAKTKADAVRKAIEKGKIGLESWFGPSAEFCQPVAEPLVLDKVLRF